MTPWLLVLLPAVVLVNTVLNGWWWPRGRRAPVRPRRISVAIPARDEEDTIEEAVRAALASDVPVDRVVVADDHSTDATARILARLRADHARLAVIAPPPLPAGWVGKPHACHHLAQAAVGDWIVFVDADTRLEPDGVRRLMVLADRYGADVVTAVPRQRMGTLIERWVMPLLHLTYTAWLPQFLVWASGDRRFLAANGQVLAVSRRAYDTIGGFAAVRGAVVDDMAFCRRAKEHGLRVVFADGHDVASCRMYTSAREVWRGFSKNIYRGLGSPVALAAALALYGTAFVLPYVVLAVGWWLADPTWLVAAAAAVGANVATRSWLAVRHGHSLGSVLVHPVAVVFLGAIALNSFRWHLRGAIEWSGRTYGPEEAACPSPSP